jgi:hypothetical protein
MRKTVKCSACGKEHDIVTEWDSSGCLKIVGFEPVKSVRDRLYEDIQRNLQTLAMAGETPHKLYLGNKEIECFSEKYNTICGFEIVEVDRCSYFHATGKSK